MNKKKYVSPVMKSFRVNIDDLMLVHSLTEQTDDFVAEGKENSMDDEYIDDNLFNWPKHQPNVWDK